MISQPQTLISRRDLATRWGMSPKTLANWACLKIGPPVVKPSGVKGAKAYYRLADVVKHERVRAEDVRAL